MLQGLSLFDSEPDDSYILASGPVGQKVNKITTAAQLRFDAARSASLPERVRVRAEWLRNPTVRGSSADGLRLAKTETRGFGR